MNLTPSTLSTPRSLTMNAASNPHSRQNKTAQGDTISFSGRNALHIAAEANNVNELQELMEDGVTREELNEQDENGNTPLHVAVMNNALLAVRKLLGKSQIELQIGNYDRKTPRELAVNPQIARALDQKAGIV